MGTKLTLWHGTLGDYDKPDIKHTFDGGLHAGTIEQAEMRAAGVSRRIFKLTLELNNIRRCRDMGGQWRERINKARREGCDAIVYLNRYEGVSLESIKRAAASGVDLDSLSDREFKRWVPEACDSYIILQNPPSIELLPTSGHRQSPSP